MVIPLTRRDRRMLKRQIDAPRSNIIAFPFAHAHEETAGARRRALRKINEAASDFINAILNASLGIVLADAHANELTASIGRYQTPVFCSAFDPLDSAPAGLVPKGSRDCIVTVWQYAPGSPLEWRYEPRTRALARMTASERRAFVTAVKTYPMVSSSVARDARAAFARALRELAKRDANARDAKMMTGAPL